MAEDPYRSPARDEIGAIVSEHRPRALHGVWMGPLLTSCVATLFEGVVSALRSLSILPAEATA
ncbi:MAG: hypothetical protein OHK0013_40910 [Sandaracinaceae bacterium]